MKILINFHKNSKFLIYINNLLTSSSKKRMSHKTNTVSAVALNKLIDISDNEYRNIGGQTDSVLDWFP